MTARKDREEVEVLRGSLHGVARVLPSCICDSGCRRGPRPGVGQQVGLRASQKVTNAPINPNLDSSSKTDIETRRKYRELKGLSERALTAAQSARQGGTEPGTTRFRDGRATTGPPAPRRGPGAPTAQPRPRKPDLESAQI